MIKTKQNSVLKKYLINPFDFKLLTVSYQLKELVTHNIKEYVIFNNTKIIKENINEYYFITRNIILNNYYENIEKSSFDIYEKLISNSDSINYITYTFINPKDLSTTRYWINDFFEHNICVLNVEYQKLEDSKKPLPEMYKKYVIKDISEIDDFNFINLITKIGV